MREQWIEAPRMEGNKSLAGKFGISPLTVRLIRNRAGESEEAVRTYLWGDLDSLGDAGQMKGMKEAAALLGEKAAAGLAMRIIGDYDIDGVNATHILLTALRRIGAKADTVIPDRMKDGYGINENLIKAAKEAGVDTIVTCDNGIAALKEITNAKSLAGTASSGHNCESQTGGLPLPF